MSKIDNYILFIDESGKSKLSDVGDHFILCGIIINKDLNSALSHYMLSLKDKSAISPDENIHAFDLFESENVKSVHHKHQHITVFFDRLCALVQGADIKCIIVRISKLEYQGMVSKRARELNVSDKNINKRLKKVDQIMKEALMKDDVEDITKTKLNNLAGDRVSKFTDLLKAIKPISIFGDPTA